MSIRIRVPKLKKRWGKPQEGESLKMLAAGSLAFAKAYSSVEKLENELEVEIQRDREGVPKKGFARLRRQGGKVLLSKCVLLFIVTLNIVDCCLVLGELILDLHFVKDILTQSEESSSNFIHHLQDNYPQQFANFGNSDINLVYQKILEANMLWTDVPPFNSSYRHPDMDAIVANGTYLVQTNVSSSRTNSGYRKRSVSGSGAEEDMTYSSRDSQSIPPLSSEVTEDHSLEEDIGHVFHISSVTICVILVVWTSLKIICFGRQFLERKLEVFDAFIVLLSFVVDLIFIKGLAIYTIQEFVFILAFMLPWRVIRVTNSLVVTVKDHEHFRLKLLYTQKKKVENEIKQLKGERESFREQVESLKRLCLDEGIDDIKIFQALARQPVRPGKGVMGSFASLAFGALNNTKSASIWSVLGTPRMRRGKSMDIVENQKVHHDSHKRHSKGRIFSFLGSSSDFFRGKSKTGKQFSVDSDPGFAYTSKCNSYHNKRLMRTSTIDTVSTDTSMECSSELMKNVYDRNSDFTRQDTGDSSAFEDGSTMTSRSSESKNNFLSTKGGNDDSELKVGTTEYVPYRKLEQSPVIRRPTFDKSTSRSPTPARSSSGEREPVPSLSRDASHDREEQTPSPIFGARRVTVVHVPSNAMQRSVAVDIEDTDDATENTEDEDEGNKEKEETGTQENCITDTCTENDETKDKCTDQTKEDV